MRPALRVLRRGGGARLLVLPYSGGSTAGYVRLARELRGIEVIGADPPGHGACPGAPLTRYDALVGHYARAFAPVLDGALPTALFGHSLGGLAAYGLARALAARRPLVALFVSGCRPVTEPRRPRGWDTASEDGLLGVIRDLGALPDEITRTDAFRAATLERFRADLQVHDSFQMPDDPTLPLPLRVLAGRDDAIAPAAAMRPWCELAADTEIFRCRGTHMFVVHGAREVAAIVTRALAKLL